MTPTDQGIGGGVGAIQRRILMWAEAAQRIIASLMEDHQAFAALRAERTHFARIREQLIGFANCNAGATHVIIHPTGSCYARWAPGHLRGGALGAYAARSAGSDQQWLCRSRPSGGRSADPPLRPP